MGRGGSLLAAVLVAALAAGLYLSTLLPGFDLGDTASFQTMVGSPYLTPRDGYPLYYVVGNICLWLTGLEPAHAMNLASAVVAALACGLVVLLATEMSGSILAGIAAALFFAGSFTFWSQAVIAEVYALHILLVVLTLCALLRWEARPASGRLVMFFAAYALAFGNHISTILLAPGLVLFLFLAAPRGWRTILAPRIVGAALLVAAIGALQYGWNFAGVWHDVAPPSDSREAFGRFWFDVTKSDWRETMVLSVPWTVAGDRLRMYVFDVRQQFGWAGPALAALGLVVLWRSRPPRAVLAATVYLTTLAFALGYNVGDVHVFFLPSHLMLALLSAPALAWLNGRCRGVVIPIALGLLAGRIYTEYPALDRSHDHRPTELLTTLADGIDDHRAVLLTDVDWQVQNGMYYLAQEVRPDLAYARMADVARHMPLLVADNLAVGRQVIVTERAAQALRRDNDPPFDVVLDSTRPDQTLMEQIQRLPPDTRYVLTILRPLPEFPLPANVVAGLLDRLSGEPGLLVPQQDYVIVAGLVGRPPEILRGESEPWATRVVLNGRPIHIRFDGWLAFDTIRRMGFGSVIADRRRVLIVERGLSFVAIEETGEPRDAAYMAGIYEPLRRYTVRPTR
jgi:hypothetical protein